MLINQGSRLTSRRQIIPGEKEMVFGGIILLVDIEFTRPAIVLWKIFQ